MTTIDDDSVPLTSKKALIEEGALVNRAVYSPTSKKSLLRAGCILGAEFCERLAYYSIDANLVLLFGGLGMGTQNANILALFWKGTGYMTPLFGGWLADSHLGRYKTIIIFISFYVLSMILLAIGVIPEIIESQSWIVFVSLFLVAICMGGIKANVVTFGADQFSGASEQVKQAFFNWFYFSINFGSLISFTAIAYVQQNISFAIGLGIPAGVMFLSAVFFVSGSKLYDKLPPSGSILSRCVSMVVQCAKASPEIKNKCPTFLDRAKLIIDKNGEPMFKGTEVEDFKTFTKILPVQGTYVMFWCLYAQMSSVFFSQGTVMRLRVTDAFSIPVSSLQVFNSAVIMLLVPLFDRIVYPTLRRKNINFSPLKRIGTGFFLATIAMIYAGGLEVYRLSLYKKHDTVKQELDGVVKIAANLSIFWQAPGFMLIGAAEVLASITGLEFAYEEAPPTMRSMVNSIYLLTTALGNYLGLMLVFSVNLASQPRPWIADDLNESHLDLYFFTLASLGFIDLFIFMFIADRYKSRKERALGVEEINGNK